MSRIEILPLHYGKHRTAIRSTIRFPFQTSLLPTAFNKRAVRLNFIDFGKKAQPQRHLLSKLFSQHRRKQL